jgi:hypothetical protein
MTEQTNPGMVPDNALAEPVIVLYKTELIKPRGPAHRGAGRGGFRLQWSIVGKSLGGRPAR